MISGSLTTVAPRRFSLDLLRPIFILLAAVLAVLVILPLFWLLYYSFLDDTGAATLENFKSLVTDPAMRRSFLLAVVMAAAVGLVSCAVATPMAWLVARTDLPGRNVVRALVTASFVTPPFLGAIAWELLAAPNSGLINQLYRWLFGLDADSYLFNIYSFEGLI